MAGCVIRTRTRAVVKFLLILLKLWEYFYDETQPEMQNLGLAACGLCDAGLRRHPFCPDATRSYSILLRLLARTGRSEGRGTERASATSGEGGRRLRRDRNLRGLSQGSGEAFQEHGHGEDLRPSPD